MADLNDKGKRINELYFALREELQQITTSAVIAGATHFQLEQEEVRATIGQAVLDSAFDTLGASHQTQGADYEETVKSVETTVVKAFAKWVTGAKSKFAKAEAVLSMVHEALDKAGFPKAEPRRPN